MSQENLQLRFDGPGLRDHAMDVTLLGPSLFAFGELCIGANQVLNGEKATIRLLVKADMVANCVTIDLQVIQMLWEPTKSLVGNIDVATASSGGARRKF